MTDPDQLAIQELERRTADTARAARRLTSGAAAIGAALLASLQLAQLGAVSGAARIVVASVCATGAVAAVIIAVLITVRVMLPGNASIHQLARRERQDERLYGRDPFVTYAQRNATTLLRRTDDSISKLADDYAAVLRTRHAAAVAVNVHGDSSRLRDANEAHREAVALNRLIARLVATARMEDARRAYDGAARSLAGLVVLLVLALIGLSWALNAPGKPAADLRGANLDHRALQGVKLRGAVLDGMRIAHADLRGTDLSGASIDGTSWIDTICPDGVDSEDAGGTCAGHLTP